MAHMERKRNKLENAGPVVIGQQNSEKDYFEKINYESLFEQQSSSEEEMSYNNPQEELQMKPQILEKTWRKDICREQSMWHEEEEEEGKTGSGENLMKSIMVKL